MIDYEPPCSTINACNRCRRRKAKCDPGLPSCAPCLRAGSVCEYADPRTRTVVPRSTIFALEDELNELSELAAASAKTGSTRSRDGDADAQPSPIHPRGDTRTEMANADLIRVEPGEDAHFLGVSSGMHLARSVLESAQRSDAHFQSTGETNRQPLAASSSDTDTDTDTRSYAPSCAALPSRETAIHLIDIFLSQYEVQYPIVVGDELAAIVHECYGSGSHTAGDASQDQDQDQDQDVRSQFILKMVFAIALVVLSREHPESLALAKTFSRAVMADLSSIMQQRKGLRTLQCLQFLLLWSILDASSAPIWYISGLCMRMCVDLGVHSETTLRVASHGSEVDKKRRLFWVTYTFDRTLATLLGRPFTLSDSVIDVQLPRASSSSLPAAKRNQILHWFKLQQLQSQIVSRLYSLRSDGGAPTLSLDATATTARWKADMGTQLRLWGRKAASLADPSSSCGGGGDGDGLHGSSSGNHTLDWWEYWHQNAVLLLHRPSPLKPQLDAAEADTCCTAAQHMIQLSFTRLQRGSADFAWVDLHYQLMSGITLLFLVWKHLPTRAKAKTSWTSFKNCLVQWTCVLDQLARRWERIRRARDVLARLVDNTVDAIEKELCNRQWILSACRTCRTLPAIFPWPGRQKPKRSRLPFWTSRRGNSLELYETFGAMPENMTMLDYFSTTATGTGTGSSHDTGMGLDASMANGASAGGQGSSGNGNGSGVADPSGWPDSLTDSILNFQTSFPELDRFACD